MTRLRAALLAAALTGSLAVSLPAPPATAQRGQPPARPRLVLTDQSAFVPPGGQFTMKLRVDRTNVPPSAELAVTLYRAVETRSEFEQTVQDRISRSPLQALPPVPLTSLATDSGGDITIRVPADLTDNGVYPVRVELRERGGPSLDRFVTHLVHFATSPVGPKLGLSLVVPLQAPIGLPADGPRQVEALDELAGAAQAIEAARGLPFALAPSPETVASLAASREDRAVRALETLRRVVLERPVLAAPYVPVSLPALLANDLQEEFASQLSRGATVVADVLRARPETRVWLGIEPLDLEAVDELVRRGFDRVVAADATLEPVPNQSLTLTRPFLLGGGDTELWGLAADAGLGNHFNADPNQVLQAHHLLADLAVLWLDAPGDDRRAVVALPRREWKANRPFLDALAAGLAQSPVAEAVSLDTVFSAVTPAVTARGAPLVRNPTGLPPTASGGLSDIVSEVRQLRRRLASLGSVLGDSIANSVLLEERLLVAQSSELRTVRQRQAYLSAVETGIADQLEAIEMPQGRSITLTARRGEIPVTFQNRTGSPARVVVSVQSDKLEFPEGDSRPLELNRRNTTERFSVVARTSGAFPLRITLVSPDGNLVIGRARLTVRSTAASRVSVFVSAGAALFLAVWWAQHVVRGRRARRLVPS